MTPARPQVVTLFRVAAVLITITVVMGSMVAATESGAACPTWPGCYPGQFGPRLHLNPIVEFTHRVIAGIGLLACLAAGFAGLRDPGVEPAVKPLPFVAFLGGVASAVFGALTVLIGIGKAAGVIDLTAALVAMAAAILAAVRVGRPSVGWRRDLTTWGAAAMVVVLVVMHQLGIVVAAPNSFTRVISWPVWVVVPGDLFGWLQVVRIVLAMLVLALAAVTLWSGRARLRTASLLVGVAIAAELLVGLVVMWQGLSMGLAALYSGLAGATLATTAWLAALATRATSLPAGGTDAAAAVADEARHMVGP